MKIHEAWTKAKSGQLIYRKEAHNLIGPIEKDGYERAVRLIPEVMYDLSADDWEIVKEKHNLIFTNIDLSGTIGDKTISQILHGENLERPELFTKVVLEWEDE